MSELKSCPFCGGEAKVFAKHYENGAHEWWVGCVKCGATIVGETSILAWNTRAERTCRDTGECRWFCCSECGFGFNDIYANKEREYGVDVSFPNFCPYCGARVKEE